MTLTLRRVDRRARVLVAVSVLGLGGICWYLLIFGAASGAWFPFLLWLVGAGLLAANLAIVDEVTVLELDVDRSLLTVRTRNWLRTTRDEIIDWKRVTDVVSRSPVTLEKQMLKRLVALIDDTELELCEARPDDTARAAAILHGLRVVPADPPTRTDQRVSAQRAVTLTLRRVERGVRIRTLMLIMVLGVMFWYPSSFGAWIECARARLGAVPRCVAHDRSRERWDGEFAGTPDAIQLSIEERHGDHAIQVEAGGRLLHGSTMDDDDAGAFVRAYHTFVASPGAMRFEREAAPGDWIIPLLLWVAGTVLLVVNLALVDEVIVLELDAARSMLTVRRRNWLRTRHASVEWKQVTDVVSRPVKRMEGLRRLVARVDDEEVELCVALAEDTARAVEALHGHRS